MSKSNLNSFSQWIYPLVFGVTAYFFVRIVTDIPLHNAVVPANHVVGIAWALIFSYSLYFACRFHYYKKWKYNHKGLKLFTEYAGVFMFLLIVINSGILISFLFKPVAPIIDLNDNPAGGVVIVNTICMAFSLLYYTIIRSQWIGMNQEIQLEKVKRDQVNTELDLLKAQYHPHFLFNALNTIYFQLDGSAHPARETVELLSGLLRYQLYEVNRKVIIGKEIEYLETFIRFQQLRTTDRLKLHTFFDPSLKEQEIHPLLFQPLVENAFKYLGGGYELSVCMEWHEEKIYFRVRNSTPLDLPAGHPNKAGIGIENLRRRLLLLYPGKHELQFCQERGNFQAVLMICPE